MKKIFEKNKSAVILNPERRKWVSRSHVTGVEIVVNDGVKTQCYSAKRDLYGDFAYAQPLKMTEKALSFLSRCCASANQGISATASCREAHKRRFLLNQLILRFANASLVMTIPMLALLFTIAIIAESHAASDCAEGEQNCWDCGKTENDLCTARLNTATKALSITGSGEMRDYQGKWDSTENPTLNNPWQRDYTSISIQGIKKIGERAFNYSYITNVSLDDSLTEIGKHAFLSCFSIPQIIVPDSVETIGDRAFYMARGLQNLFISDSVVNIGEKAFNEVGGIIFCPSNVNCTGKGEIGTVKTYTKDSDGVYKIGNNYFASPDDMLANRSCGSGSSASQDCINAAKTYQEQKAENMAGGALCATKQDCLKLIDRANKKDVCTSIADCAFRENCSKQGNVVYNNECLSEYPFAKKRWTPAEANEWLHDGNDNFVIITFKK